MLSISITIPKGQIEESVERAVESIDVKGILDEAGAALFNRVRDRFLRQENPDGVPWIPSKASLLRQLTGRDGGTLFDTGTLFHSIQLHAPDSDSREIATDVPYGKFHQFGTKTVPVREFLGFNKDDETLFMNIVQTRLKEG